MKTNTKLIKIKSVYQVITEARRTENLTKEKNYHPHKFIQL